MGGNMSGCDELRQDRAAVVPASVRTRACVPRVEERQSLQARRQVVRPRRQQVLVSSNHVFKVRAAAHGLGQRRGDRNRYFGCTQN